MPSSTSRPTATLAQSRMQLTSMRATSFSLVVAIAVFCAFAVFIWTEIWSEASAPAMARIFVTGMAALALLGLLLTLRSFWRAHRALRELSNGAMVQAPGRVHWRQRAYRAEANGISLNLLRGQELSPGHYDFQYLPDTGYVVAAIPTGESQTEEVIELVDALGSVFGFAVTDLDDCRSGRLSPSLRRRVTRTAVGSAAALGLLALIMVGFAVLIAAGALRARGNQAVGVGMGLVVAGVGVFLAYQAVTVVMAARRGIVDMVEGIVTERVRRSRRSTSYYLDVGGRSFSVGPSAHAVMVARQPYRVYYLRGTNNIVAIEPLV